MDNEAEFQEILNNVDTLSTKDKTKLIERVAIKLKQELTAQNLVPRKSLKNLWKNCNTCDGLMLSAKNLNRIANLESDNTRLFQEIEAATEDLLFYSENEYSSETFTWEVNKQGDFNLANFLLDDAFIRTISEEEFLNLIQPANIYISGHTDKELESKKASPEQLELFQKIQDNQTQFLDLLKSQAQTVEIFRFEIWDDHDRIVYEACDFVIAQLNNSNWLGFIPCVEILWIPDEMIPLSEQKNIKPETLELQRQVLETLKNSKLPMIQCYSTTMDREFTVEVDESKNALITRLLHNSGFAIATIWQKFSDYYNNCNDETEEVRYQNLDCLLESNLKNIKEYVIGSGAVYYVYVIGEAKTGDYLGVSTIAIHT
ncbi:hypothetical protein IQ249_17765 [Lusitaniella coriacea LEGE 07157]|uniref:Uncharacterized protein n=1 Tax=Lusitaniella coriacea LEGE 07157 TaxID=945747 RepID=A0A8J7IW41_9CYAN|nr:nuclease A inhibitor family protein [Lusitaniella coriacea]MBE9117748.1 hypothetical protein [Lusitaniella coriacea LEGE 07157]